MAQVRIEVEPSVLVWARKTLGLPVAAAARKIGVSEAVLHKWEAGELRPTIIQLRKAAKAYKRPLAVLLLSEPPVDFQPLRDYRTTTGRAPEFLSPELLGEIRRAHTQREVLLEISEVAPDLIDATQPIPTSAPGDDPEDVGASIREFLEVPFGEQRSWTTPEEALRRWIEIVESRGILLVQTQGVKISEVRGFSVGEAAFPIVALNGSDWPSARVFTLFHELTHLSLGEGGLCDLHEKRQVDSPIQAQGADQVEHFCNAAAAAALLPEPAVRSEPLVRSGSAAGWNPDNLYGASRAFSVSSEALLLRLITLGLASWDDWFDLKPILDEKYAEAVKVRKQKQRDAEGGPSYYVVKARDLGRGYVATVLDAYRAHAISSVDASYYLEVKHHQIGKLSQVVGS